MRTTIVVIIFPTFGEPKGTIHYTGSCAKGMPTRLRAIGVGVKEPSKSKFIA